jgi:acid phosphatase (class A)
MKNSRSVLGTLGFVAIVTVAWAKSDVPNPHWLTQDEIKSILTSEPPPPAPGSEAEQADLQTVLDAQKTRDAARIAEAQTDKAYSTELFTKPVVPQITPTADPGVFHFMEEVDKQTSDVMTQSKDRWHRPRPFLAHADVVHPLFKAGGFSYPSGHSMHAFVYAIVLGEIFPDKAQAFLERAQQIAQSRVDAGVHYTTDIKEGEAVGREIASDLNANPEFRQELDAAKAEVTAQK